ncbi:Protein mlp1 [Sorochytrium milnesiophthora]
MSADTATGDDAQYRRLYLELRAAKERDDIEHDQTVQDYQTRLDALQLQVRAVTDSREEARSLVEQLQHSVAQLSASLSKEQLVRQQAEAKAQSLQAHKDAVEHEKRDVLKVSERHLEIEERRNAEYEGLLERYQTVRKDLENAFSELSEYKSKASTAEFKSQNLEREVELVRKQCAYFEEQYRARTSEIALLRKEKSAEIFELKDRVGSLSSQAEINSDRADTLQKLVEELQQRLQQSLQDAADVRNELILKEEQYKKEISVREQAVRSYGAVSVDSKERVASLQALIQDLEMNLRDKSAEMAEYMDAEAERIAAVTEERTYLQTETERLKQELQLANELIEDIRASNGTSQVSQVSPTAALAMRSQTYGKTWTELFAEKCQLEADMRTLKSKNERLEETMEAIIAEVQSKAPLFNQLAADNDHLRQAHEEASDRCTAVRLQNQKLEQQVTELQQSVRSLTSDLQLARQLTADFSQQIQYLLTYNGSEGVNDVRALVLQWLEGISAQDDQMQSEAQLTLSKHFIVHGQVETLVKRNEQLVGLARKLTTEVETYESQIAALGGRQASEVAQELAECKSTIEDLRDRLEQQQSAVTAVNGRLLPDGAQFFMNTTSGDASLNTNKDESAASFMHMYNELREHYDAFVKESRSERETLYADLDRVREEGNGYKVELAQAQVKLQYHKDQLESSETLNAQNQKDKARLSEQLTKYQVMVTELQQRQNEAHNQAAELRSKNEELVASQATLAAERDLHKTICSSLKDQLKSLEQVIGQNERAVHVARDAQETIELSIKEERSRLSSHIEKLEDELHHARRKADELAQYNQTLAAKYDLERSKLQEKLDELRAEHTELETSRRELQALVEAAKASDASARQELELLQRGQAHTAGSTGSTADTAVLGLLKKDVEVERHRLAVLQREFDALKEKEHRADRELAELTASYQALQQDAQLQQTQLQQLADERIEQIQALNTSLLTAQDQLREAEANAAAQRTALETELADLHARLASAQAIADGAEQVQAQLRDEIERGKQQYDEAVSSYNDEVMKHARAIERMRPLQEELAVARAAQSQHKAQMEAAQRQAAELRKAADEARQAWNEEKRLLSTNMEELQKQNDSLNSLYMDLSARLAETHSSSLRGENSANDNSEVRHLNELINSLRSQLDQERFLLQTDKQLMKAKAEELEVVRHQLAETKARLDAERRRQDAQVPLLQVAEMQSRLRQLETTVQEVDILKQEKRRLTAEVEELRAEVADATRDRFASREELSDAKIKLESYEGRIQQLMESLTAMRKRHQDILEKYQRIDPVEHETLKKQVQTLEESQATWPQQIAAFEEEISRMKEDRSSLIARSNEKVLRAGRTIGELRAQIAELRKQVEDNQVSASTEKDQQIAQLTERCAALETEVNALRAQVSSAPSGDKVQQLEAQCSAAQTELAALKERHQKLLQNSRQIRDNAAQREEQLKREIEAAQTQWSGSGAEAEELKEQVKKLEKEKGLLEMRLSIFKGKQNKRPREDESAATTAPTTATTTAPTSALSSPLTTIAVPPPPVASVAPTASPTAKRPRMEVAAVSALPVTHAEPPQEPEEPAPVVQQEEQSDSITAADEVMENAAAADAPMVTDMDTGQVLEPLDEPPAADQTQQEPTVSDEAAGHQQTIIETAMVECTEEDGTVSEVVSQVESLINADPPSDMHSDVEAVADFVQETIEETPVVLPLDDNAGEQQLQDTATVQEVDTAQPEATAADQGADDDDDGKEEGALDEEAEQAAPSDPSGLVSNQFPPSVQRRVTAPSQVPVTASPAASTSQQQAAKPQIAKIVWAPADASAATAPTTPRTLVPASPSTSVVVPPAVVRAQANAPAAAQAAVATAGADPNAAAATPGPRTRHQRLALQQQQAAAAAGLAGKLLPTIPTAGRGRGGGAAGSIARGRGRGGRGGGAQGGTARQ